MESVRIIGVIVSRIGSVQLQKVAYTSDTIEKARSDTNSLASVRLNCARGVVPPYGYETVIFEAWPPMCVQAESGKWRVSTMFGYGFLPIGFEVNQESLESRDMAVMSEEVERLAGVAIDALPDIGKCFCGV
jgi:hypothetical protein